MDYIEQKMDTISMLTKRDVERKLNLQKKKQDESLISADNEKLDYFQKIFDEKYSYIENLINNSTNITSKDLPDHFNIISKETLLLQKYVAASNLFLRNYDIQRCQQGVQELTMKAKLFEDQLLPKKKFGFKNKNKKQEKLNGLGKDTVDYVAKKIVQYKENFCGFSNKKNENLVLKGDEIFKRDVTLEKIENCNVYFYGSPSTLHLNFLKNCKVFSGPVSTSIFAENCENCVFVIACQQLRLHSSKNVKIYLHVTSRAIMEDCHDISTAPYNWEYGSILNDFKQAGLDYNTNNWKCLDDFNWLNIDRQSPNWKIIEEEDRVQKWDLDL